MNGETTTLSALLDGRSYLEIPAYQRTYEWTAKEWKRLFGDVLLQSGFSPDGLEATRPSHFMGTILTSVEQVTTRWSRHALVDGQQRLVTMSLLSAAIRHAKSESDGLSPEEGGTDWFTFIPLAKRASSGYFHNAQIIKTSRTLLAAAGATWSWPDHSGCRPYGRHIPISVCLSRSASTPHH